MKNGNLPAMPTTEFQMGVGNEVLAHCSTGLSKREEFVKSFIQGLLANSGGPIQASSLCGFTFCNTDIPGMVKLAIEIADCSLDMMGRTK